VRVCWYNAPVSLTHVNPETGAAQMVDVSSKADTRREAFARARVRMKPETLTLIRENALKKGDALAVARIAGILAAKRTDELIPLCHTLPLSSVQIDFTLDQAHSFIEIIATAATVAQTGVEMEALTAATVAALTIYDMAKSSDRAMSIDEVRLLRKTGGKSGDYAWTE
jgi:cyclic pyranopterin phosphate synthase